jgi:lysosomal acid lipase/cholesteryl ester hydrolase
MDGCSTCIDYCPVPLPLSLLLLAIASLHKDQFFSGMVCLQITKFSYPRTDLTLLVNQKKMNLITLLQFLGTYLHDMNCDVWLANSRGNKHTRHTSLNPSSKEYWNFSLTEYALDVHSVVSFILEETKSPSLAFIGFSQGSTIGLAALSLYEDLNCKIHQFIGLAPNIKPKKWNNKSLHSVIEWMSPEGLTLLFGKRGFLPIASIVSDYFPQKITKSIIFNVINSSLGWKLDQYGEDQRQLSLYKHIFGLTSVKSFVHWFQIMRDERFQHFDDRNWIWPFLTGSEKEGVPPILFPVKHITTQISLYWYDPLYIYTLLTDSCFVVVRWTIFVMQIL